MIAVAVGVPLGLWLGRLTFDRIGTDQGFGTGLAGSPSVWALALLAPLFVALAALACALPARIAAGVPVAEVLRAE